MKAILKYGAVTLLAAAIVAMPTQLLAQNTNKAPAEKKTAVDKKSTTDKKETGKEEKKAGHPFHGKLAAVDQSAKTVTIGKSTYQITSETKIKKAGKPATLSDGVVGEEVGGYAKPDEQGKMVATTLNFNSKSEGKEAEKKSPGKKK